MQKSQRPEAEREQRASGLTAEQRAAIVERRSAEDALELIEDDNEPVVLDEIPFVPAADVARYEAEDDLPLITAGEINAAYTKLAVARTSLHGAKVAELLAEWNLKSRRATAIRDEKIVGKNPEAREAAERALLIDEYAAQHNTSVSLLDAQMGFDLARYEVQRVRALQELIRDALASVEPSTITDVFGKEEIW